MTLNWMAGMNKSLTLAALISATSLAIGDELFIGDDQVLTGQLVSSSEGTLELKHPSALDTLSLNREKISKISFNRELDLSSQPNEVLFLDGSRLSGQLVSFDDGAIIFRSPSVGEIKLQQDQIASLFFHSAKQRNIFSMNGREEQWEVGENSDWEFDPKAESMINGKSSATAGIEVELPDHYRIDFEAAWPQQPKFELLFGSDELSYGPDSHYYKVVVNRGGVEIRRASKGKQRSVPLNAEVNFDFSVFREKGEVNFSLDVDRRNQVIILYINNEIVGKFNDFENGAALGNAIFYKAGSANQRVSKFSVFRVSGGATVERDEALAMDQLVSVEGDQVVGSLDKLILDEAGDKLQFTTKHGDEESKLTVSLENIEVIHFKGPKIQEPEASDLTQTAKGEKIFGSVGDITKETISINSPTVGEVKLLREAAESILFEDEEKQP